MSMHVGQCRLDPLDDGYDTLRLTGVQLVRGDAGQIHVHLDQSMVKTVAPILSRTGRMPIVQDLFREAKDCLMVPPRLLE
jgi:hypothetical protein